MIINKATESVIMPSFTNNIMITDFMNCRCAYYDSDKKKKKNRSSDRDRRREKGNRERAAQEKGERQETPAAEQPAIEKPAGEKPAEEKGCAHQRCKIRQGRPCARRRYAGNLCAGQAFPAGS